MKNLITIMLILIILTSIVNLGTSEISINNESILITDNYVGNTIISKSQEEQILRNLNEFGGHFTKNQGQVGNDLVRYYIQDNGIWFLDDGVMFDLKEQPQDPIFETQNKYQQSYENNINDEELIRGVRFKLNFVSSNQVTPVGIDRLLHNSNFFYSNDPAEWCTDVPNYYELVYENIYDEIDLRYYLTSNGLKYDFIVHPGGEPADIVLNYEGIENLHVDTKGDLIIQTAIGEIQDTNLFIYQSNTNAPIKGKFKLYNSNTFGFEMTGSYDKNHDLVIDPALAYSTYLGGSGMDLGNAIEVDSTKNAYVTGYTASTDFNMTGGCYQSSKSGNNDAFVLKINDTGKGLVWATYIGGTGNDQARDLAIDSRGNAYVTGFTQSTDFPTTGTPFNTSLNGNQDAFCLNLSSGGNILSYSTYYGGGDYDTAHSIALNSSNNMYITGETQSSTDLPVTPGCLQPFWGGGPGIDAFFAIIDPAGGGTADLKYSTYIGGGIGAGIPGIDLGFAIAVDSSGNAYITGTTYSTDFNTTTNAFSTSLNGFSDAFILKINPGGSGTSDLVYSTYVGGSISSSGTAMQEGYGIALDSNNYAVIAGKTNANNFPTTINAYDNTFNTGLSGIETDIFVFKINPVASAQPSYSTYIGGSSDDIGHDIKVDTNDDAYIISASYWDAAPPSDFPTTSNAYEQTHKGGYDVAVCKLSTTSTNLAYSSFLGGGGYDFGYGIAYDSEYRMYATGYTGGVGPFPGGDGFPNSTGAYDQTFNGDFMDAFATKLEFYNTPVVLDLNLSWFDVNRTKLVHVYVNGSDIEDIETNLTPHFEYRDPSNLVWNRTYFTNPTYNNSRWETSFTPPINSTVGYYDIRARFNDTDSMFSGWYTLDDILFVKNNYPIIIDLKLSKSSIIQQENISFWVNGSDIEDAEKNLTMNISYRDPNENFWNTTFLGIPAYINNHWSINFSVPFGAPFGNYDLRVRVNDSDGNFSKWLYMNDSLSVINLKPDVLDIQITQNSIYRTGSVELYINGTDYESTESNLTLIFQYKSDVDGVWNSLVGTYQNNRSQVIFFTGKSTSIGNYNFRARFKDQNNDVGDWLYFNNSLMVLNNQPDMENILLSKNYANYGENIKIWVNGNDLEEPEINLTPKLEYRDPDELAWLSSDISPPIYNVDKWEFEFSVPNNAIFGTYDFRAKVNDSDGDHTDWIYDNDTLTIENTIPTVIDIVLDKSSIYRTNSDHIYINGLDLETPESMLTISIQYKSKLTSVWKDLIGEYSTLNESWESIFTTTENSVLGYYDFRVKFEDNETDSSGWIYKNDSLEVLNNLPVISNDLDELSVGTDPILVDLTEYEFDVEDTDADLVWGVEVDTYDYLESVDMDDVGNDVLKIIPLNNTMGAEDIKLILTDKDAGSTSKSNITVHVDSRSFEDIPKVTLISPLNGSIINTLKPTLKWELNYTGTESIKYTVTLEDYPKPRIPIKTGLTSTEYTLETELEDGKTYYWKVEPINGICLSGVFSFSIDLGFELIYEVNLTAERDSVTIIQGGSKNINLTIKNEGNAIDSFQIDVSSSNLESYVNIDKTNVQLDPEIDSLIRLSIDIPEDFSTGDYKITVTATSVTDITALDEVTIDVNVVSKDFVPEYNVSISVSPSSLKVKQGDTENVTITIINNGNIEDDLTINYESDNFPAGNIQFSKSSSTLPDGDSDTIRATINIPENLEPGEYTIKFIIEGSGDPKESTLTITVQDKDAEEPKDKDSGEDNTMLYALIGIIVVIIVVLILLFIFLKKKKGKEEEPPVDEAEPSAPEEVPSEQVPAQEPSLADQPPTPEIQPKPAPAPEQLPSEQPPKPQLSTEEPSQVLPQVEQVPQLTPAPVPQVKEEPPVPKVKQSPQPQVDMKEPEGEAPVPKVKTQPTIKENNP